MLRRLDIRGFQAHRNRSIKLRRITTIVGPTDSGKSSVLRALRWVSFNKPSGTAFINWDEERAAVRLLAEKDEIVRTRSAKSNTYRLNGKILKSFKKSGVPSPVSDVLKIGPDNFQSQHDSVYWFTLTGGQLAKELNRIVNLDCIDKALALSKSRVSEARTRARVCEEQLAKDNQIVKELKWSVKFGAAVEELKSIDLEHQHTGSQIDELEALIDEIEEAEKDIQPLQERLSDIDKALEHADEYEQLSTQRDELESLIDEIEGMGQDIESSSERLAAIDKQLTKAVGTTCPLCERPYQ